MRPVRPLVCLVFVLALAAPASGAEFAGSLERERHWVHEGGDVVVRLRLFIKTPEHRYRLIVDGAQPPVRSHVGVRVVGTLHADVIHAKPTDVHEVGGHHPPVGDGTAPGAAAVALVWVNLLDAHDHAHTMAEMRDLAFGGTDSVAEYFRTISDGSYRLRGDLDQHGDVFGPYTIPFRITEGCHPNAWVDAARAAAASAEVGLGHYDHVVYVFPRLPPCDWSGLGHVPGKVVWIKDDDYDTRPTLAHELGHNLGLWHTGWLRCERNGVKASVSASCERDNVDSPDPWGLMASQNMRWLPGYQAAFTGFLSGKQILTPTAGGSATIVPMERRGAGVKLVRLAWDHGHSLDLEVHEPAVRWAPYTSADRVVRGVTIRDSRMSLHHGGSTSSLIVDATPETESFEDATFLPGQSLTGVPGGLTVSTGARTPAGAEVSWRFDAAPDVTAPSDPGHVRALRDAGGTMGVTWSPSTDDRGVDHYLVFRHDHDTRGWHLVGRTREQRYEDRTVTPGGWYIYGIESADAWGNSSARPESGAVYFG